MAFSEFSIQICLYQEPKSELSLWWVTACEKYSRIENVFSLRKKIATGSILPEKNTEKRRGWKSKMFDYTGNYNFWKKLSENLRLFFAKIWSKRALILWESVLFNGFVKYSAIWCLFCFDLTFLDETYLKVELLPWVWVYFYNWSAFLELNFCWERESGNIYILTRLYLTLFDASRIFSPRICRLSAWDRLAKKQVVRNRWFSFTVSDSNNEPRINDFEKLFRIRKEPGNTFETSVVSNQ